MLDLITELGQHLYGVSVSTLASRHDLPAPTVHRLLQVLETGFAVKDPSRKRYSWDRGSCRLLTESMEGRLWRPPLDRT